MREIWREFEEQSNRWMTGGERAELDDVDVNNESAGGDLAGKLLKAFNGSQVAGTE